MATKNRVTAAVLSLFTGVVGGHKLYLGDTGGFMMFIFLLMFSINIFGAPLTMLLGIFEAFSLFSMTDEQFDKKYNKGIRKPRVRTVDRRREQQLRKYQTENVKRGYDRPRQQQKSVRKNPFKASGLAKYKDFDLDEAIVDFKKGLDISPNDIALHFNLACAYSLTEKKELSYSHLAKAVSLGFNDFERIMSHDDLAFMRIQPEFEAFKTSGFRNIGGMKTNNSTETIVKEAEKQDDVLLSQLNRLSELRNRGILSESEFLQEKKKLMNR